MIEKILNPIFAPLLRLHPFLVILIVSFLATLLVTYIYKWMTDQKLMKKLKDEINGFQEDMRKNRNDPKKMLGVQKKAMDVNMQYMMHSLKPTLVTFIPVIIIFAWLNVNLSYEPIKPYQDFKMTAYFKEGSSGSVEIIAPQNIKIQDAEKKEVKDNKAEWTLKGAEGEYLEKNQNALEIKYNGRSYFKDAVISGGQVGGEVKKLVADSEIKEIDFDSKPLRPLGTMHIFSWYPGWLGVYITLSIIFSLAMRKVLNIY